MKKLFILTALLLSLAVFASCETGASTDKTDPENNDMKIEDYFAAKENTIYHFLGTGNEFASYIAFNDYVAENKIQQRINNAGTQVVNIIECKDGSITVLYCEGEVFYRENMLDTNCAKKEVLLKEPLTIGCEWTLLDGSIRIITNTNVNVSTPSGEYEAIEVTTVNGGAKTIQYYAKNVGLVKNVYRSENDDEISSILSKTEENASLTQSIEFYYPNINDDKIYYKVKNINFKTNDITKDILTEAYKEDASSKMNRVLSENTKIESLYLGTDGMVYIDLNGAFLSEMNAGSGYEEMILQSITNTFGKYYGTDKAVITVDNKPYSSGHIMMEEGDYFKTDFSNSVKTD